MMCSFVFAFGVGFFFDEHNRSSSSAATICAKIVIVLLRRICIVGIVVIIAVSGVFLPLPRIDNNVRARVGVVGHSCIRDDGVVGVGVFGVVAIDYKNWGRYFFGVGGIGRGFFFLLAITLFDTPAWAI